MDIIKVLTDKVNQGLIRVTNARDQLTFCEYIFNEKVKSDISHKKNDFMYTFFSENQEILTKLFLVNLRMAIIDVNTLIAEKEENSFIKINKILRSDAKVKKELNHFDKIINYISSFEKTISKFDKIQDEVSIIRDTYIAHTDGFTKRVKFAEYSIQAAELQKLVLHLFAYYLNLDTFIKNLFNGNTESLFRNHSIGTGLNNTLSEMQLSYEKKRMK